MKTTDYCSTCKSHDVPLMKSSTNADKSIQYHRCRPCAARRQRKYYVAQSRNSYKQYRKWPHKQKARAKLNHAVTAGKVIKPHVCEVCNELAPLQGHHFDYEKPLEVTWCCTSCHADIHRVL